MRASPELDRRVQEARSRKARYQEERREREQQPRPEETRGEEADEGGRALTKPPRGCALAMPYAASAWLAMAVAGHWPTFFFLHAVEAMH